MITDLSYLKTMSGGDPKFIREMIDLFREQVAEYEKLMPELLKKGDFDSLSKLAHKAKSSVAVMGMGEEAEMLKELEILAVKGESADRYESMVGHFLSQIRQAVTELEGLS